MTEWSGDRVRQTFVDFFIKKSHAHIPSSSVVPLSDPTLLFANSGMTQFKSIFLGSVDPKSDLGKLKRACNSQKCIRAGGKHNDLDDVGKDTYHHTFFEMLGNWSFGDYFKAEAIDWAWELLTEVYKLDKSRLYVTYFRGDEKLKLPADLEAKELWKKHLPEERILPFDMKANFWEMGDVGPCGPCSEIHFDRIGGRDAANLVNMDDPDVIEIWNLVFMQFNREADGSLTNLPKKHIDTGMGLERVASILQNVRSNYDTDFFIPLFKAIQAATNPAHPYTGKLGNEDIGHVDTAYRVVADHLRTLCHAVADGAEPGSFGRNYVLRRIVRRALRYGTEKLGANDRFFHELVDVLVEQRGTVFPELKHHQERIKQLLKKEEDLWTDTYSKGKGKLKQFIDSNKGAPVSADQIFRLKTTYGFPVDLVLRILEEDYKVVIPKEVQKEVDVLIEKFKEESGVQAEAKTDLKLNVHSIDELKRKNVPLSVDVFKYQPEIDIEASVLAVWDGKNIKESGKEGKFALVLDKTNFYAQQGGQIYDTGYLTVIGSDVSFYIDEVYVCGGYIVHVGVATGEISVGNQAKLTVNIERRRPIMNNHTATHMLNFALRGVIGETNQKGSDVLPDRFRFDFSHSSSLEADQLEKVEKIVSDVIAANYTVYSAEAPLADARKINSLRQIPGEEYPNPVRIVSIGVPVEKLLAQPDNAEWLKYSVEFCGGSHIKGSGEVEDFTIIAEEPLSSGVRRIVAFTGQQAKDAKETAKGLDDKVNSLFNLSSQQKATEVPKFISELEKAVVPAAHKIALWKKIQKLQDELKEAGKSAKADQGEKANNFAKEVVANLTKEPKKVFVGTLDVGSNNVALTEAAKQIQQGAADTSVLLLSPDASKDTITIVSKVPAAAVQKGLKANEWVQHAASKCGGKGGGKPDTAQGSGKGVGNVKAASDAAFEFASSKLGL